MVRRLVSIQIIFSALVLFVCARQWALVTYSEASFPSVTLSLSGRQLDPLPTGLATATLTAALGIMVTRKFMRRAIGLFTFLAGLAIAITSLKNSESATSNQTVIDLLNLAIGRSTNGNFTVEHSRWWILTLFAGLVIGLCGLLVLVAKRTEIPLASRYERQPENSVAAISDWHALDQGIDPTE